MKRILTFVLVLLLALTVSVTVFAAEDKTIDVSAKYEDTSQYTVNVSEGGAEYVDEDGTKVSVSGIPDEAKTLVVIPVDEADTDAYAWFKDTVQNENIENSITPYAVYLYNDNGESVSSAGATVTVPVPEGYTDPIVYAIDKDGNPTKLTAEVKDATITFTSDGSLHFVVADEKETTPGTDPTPGTEPNDPDDPTDNDSFPWWIILIIVIVLCGGGFAIYWFVIKKRTWADLIAVFKR